MIISVSRRTDIPAFYSEWFIYHRMRQAEIARALRGATRRCVASVLDPYNKTRGRLAALAERGIHLQTRDRVPEDMLGGPVQSMADTAAENGMEIVSCAEEPGLEAYGVRPGKEIDDELIARVFGIRVNATKNPAMRKTCGCVISRDIGIYDACLFGYAYCYATTSFERARANHATHDPQSPSLLGWVDAPERESTEPQGQQLSLFG